MILSDQYSAESSLPSSPFFSFFFFSLVAAMEIGPERVEAGSSSGGLFYHHTELEIANVIDEFALAKAWYCSFSSSRFVPMGSTALNVFLF